VRLDVLILGIAGLVNTVLAPLDFALVLGPGTISGEESASARAEWIAEHTARWEAGWSFWFVVTLTFAWSFFALGRHLDARREWVQLALGVALLAAAVDVVGIVVNLSAVPDLAPRGDGDALYATQTLAHALTDISAFGLYSLAGLALLSALFATRAYPRRLVWLGAAEWGISAVATVLLALDAVGAEAVAAIGFALYAPWVWLSAAWLALAAR
jgi:hypothetical protein